MKEAAIYWGVGGVLGFVFCWALAAMLGQLAAIRGALERLGNT